jgi:hypothetical protein
LENPSFEFEANKASFGRVADSIYLNGKQVGARLAFDLSFLFVLFLCLFFFLSCFSMDRLPIWSSHCFSWNLAQCIVWVESREERKKKEKKKKKKGKAPPSLLKLFF